MAFPIPPDYSLYSEAMRRASQKLGSKGNAFRQLKRLLIHEKLYLHGFNPSGKLIKYPAAMWDSPRNDYLLRDDSATLVRTSELDVIFPPVEQQEELDNTPPVAPTGSANGEQPQRGRRRGRPPNIGIDDFWIEAARLVYEGEQGSHGQTQQKFIDAMLAWASKQKFKSYAKDTIIAKIEELWRRLDLGGRN